MQNNEYTLLILINNLSLIGVHNNEYTLLILINILFLIAKQNDEGTLPNPMNSVSDCKVKQEAQELYAELFSYVCLF